MHLFLQSFLGLNSPITTKLGGQIGKLTMVVLLDSGATHNFISHFLVKKAKLKLLQDNNMNIRLGTGMKVHGMSICKAVELSVQGLVFTADMIALELGSAYVISGIQWLRTLGKCEVNWATHELSFHYQDKFVTLRGDPTLHVSHLSLKTLSPTPVVQSKGILMDVGVQGMKHEQSKEINSEMNMVLQEFDGVFEEPKGLPPFGGREHAIHLMAGCGPISVRPYRNSHAHKEAMEKLVAEMLAAGTIRPGHSPFSGPVLLVKKKDGSWRFCVDYRALNHVTVADKFPIPMIYQLLDELRGAQWFSKLDLRAGYHQIRMEETNIEKTAFRTHEGHYEFLSCLLG